MGESISIWTVAVMWEAMELESQEVGVLGWGLRCGKLWLNIWVWGRTEPKRRAD